MKSKVFIFLLLLAVFIVLSACNAGAQQPLPTQPAAQSETANPPATQQPTTVPQASTLQPTPDTSSLEKKDLQGQVEVSITPLNLSLPGETLDFEVSMDTHSVDLGMDLAVLATLGTDTGITLQPLKWDAPMGGHHVSGILSFPASSNGAPVLAGVTTLTLTVVDVDVPERVFTWQLISP